MTIFGLEIDIALVFFVYGLAFFSMGLAMALESSRSSLLAEAWVLLPLALFGLVHGTHEWLEMMLFKEAAFGIRFSPIIPWLRLLLLIISIFSLFPFQKITAKDDLKILNVKGFYIGMPIDEARKIVNKHFKGKRIIIREEDKYRIGFSHEPSDICLSITADLKKKVRYIFFCSWNIDRLFQSHNLDVRQFVDKFKIMYNIPMEPFSIGPVAPFSIEFIYGWRYISPLGYQVIINASKDLEIETIPKVAK